MDHAGLLLFAAALTVAAASPGPGIVAIVARVIGRGARGAIAFAAGVAVGDIVWLSAAIVGLSVLAQTFYTAFVVIKWIGVAYLALLAWRMSMAPVSAHGLRAEQPRAERSVALFSAGLMVTMANPKVMVFYVALLPTLIDVARVDWIGWAVLSVVTLGVLAVVFGAWIGLAAQARRLFTSEAAQRRMNRGSGAAMAGAAAWVASR